MLMGQVCTAIGMLVVLLVLLKDKNLPKPIINRYLRRWNKKEKERFRAYFIKRYKHRFDCPEALERALEESWKQYCEW